MAIVFHLILCQTNAHENNPASPTFNTISETGGVDSDNTFINAPAATIARENFINNRKCKAILDRGLWSA